MSAVVVDIAEKIKDALAAATLSQAFTPTRSYAEWEETLDDYNTLHVDVVPVQNGPASNLEERALAEYTVEVDVAVRYRFGSTDQSGTTGRITTTVIDGLVLLVQEIAEFFLTDRLTDATTAVWQATSIQQSWSRKHLREMRQFFGFVRLTFLATKAVT